MKEKHIVFVGGGTVGHIAPLLAVMEAVQTQAAKKKQPLRCSYVGLADDLASPVITESKLGFEKYSIHSGKLHRFATLNQFKQVAGLLRGMGEARRLIRELKPDVVFAKGGYVTVPVALAAARRGIPVYCHESDSVPGLANKIVGRYAKGIFTSYPASVYTQFPKNKIIETGQPVRDIFYARAKTLPLIEKRALDPKTPVITVLCGSQGSRRVNALVEGAWKDLASEFQIVHITGQAEHAHYLDKWKKLPKALQKNIHVVSFLTTAVPALFQKSAVVITRAGGTVSELAAARACSLLIPLSTAAQNHQWGNARILQSAGAAVVLDETTATSAELTTLIQELQKDTREQTGLRAAIGQFDHPDAAFVMADHLLG